MTFKVGDKVKRADAGPDSIPAYRDMVGTIASVEPDGRVKVCWYPGDTDVFPRDPKTIVKANE